MSLDKATILTSVSPCKTKKKDKRSSKQIQEQIGELQYTLLMNTPQLQCQTLNNKLFIPSVHDVNQDSLLFKIIGVDNRGKLQIRAMCPNAYIQKLRIFYFTILTQAYSSLTQCSDQNNALVNYSQNYQRDCSVEYKDFGNNRTQLFKNAINFVRLMYYKSESISAENKKYMAQFFQFLELDAQSNKETYSNDKSSEQNKNSNIVVKLMNKYPIIDELLINGLMEFICVDQQYKYLDDNYAIKIFAKNQLSLETLFISNWEFILQNKHVVVGIDQFWLGGSIDGYLNEIVQIIDKSYELLDVSNVGEYNKETVFDNLEKSYIIDLDQFVEKQTEQTNEQDNLFDKTNTKYNYKDNNLSNGHQRQYLRNVQKSSFISKDNNHKQQSNQSELNKLNQKLLSYPTFSTAESDIVPTKENNKVSFQTNKQQNMNYVQMRTLNQQVSSPSLDFPQQKNQKQFVNPAQKYRRNQTVHFDQINLNQNDKFNKLAPDSYQSQRTNTNYQGKTFNFIEQQNRNVKNSFLKNEIQPEKNQNYFHYTPRNPQNINQNKNILFNQTQNKDLSKPLYPTNVNQHKTNSFESNNIYKNNNEDRRNYQLQNMNGNRMINPNIFTQKKFDQPQPQKNSPNPQFMPKTPNFPAHPHPQNLQRNPSIPSQLNNTQIFRNPIPPTTTLRTNNPSQQIHQQIHQKSIGKIQRIIKIQSKGQMNNGNMGGQGRKQFQISKKYEASQNFPQSGRQFQTNNMRMYNQMGNVSSNDQFMRQKMRIPLKKDDNPINFPPRSPNPPPTHQKTTRNYPMQSHQNFGGGQGGKIMGDFGHGNLSNFNAQGVNFRNQHKGFLGNHCGQVQNQNMMNFLSERTSNNMQRPQFVVNNNFY